MAGSSWAAGGISGLAKTSLVVMVDDFPLSMVHVNVVAYSVSSTCVVVTPYYCVQRSFINPPLFLLCLILIISR